MSAKNADMVFFLLCYSKTVKKRLKMFNSCYFQKISKNFPYPLAFFKKLCYTDINAMMEFACRILGMHRDDRLALAWVRAVPSPTVWRFAHEHRQ